MRRRVWCLLGPTGVGKTAVGLTLAQHASVPVEIVSVDSALVYRGLDIGAAKPTQLERASVPHHLIDVVDPPDTYTAGRYRTSARVVIGEIFARGHQPLLVGGTGLYLRALTQGLSVLPESDPAIRQQLQADYERLGGGALHARLAAVDPKAALRIHPNDPQRTMRALEVFLLTGRNLSSLQTGPVDEGEWHYRRVVLAPRDRRVHALALEQRFQAMLAAGLIDEVKRLLDRWELTESAPCLRAVGYRQVCHFLWGRIDYATMINQAVLATRQLAKRQLTWFRSEPAATWFTLPCASDRPAFLQYLDRLFML